LEFLARHLRASRTEYIQHNPKTKPKPISSNYAYIRLCREVTELIVVSVVMELRDCWRS